MTTRYLSPVLALAAASAALSGCLAQHIQPPPSNAVVEARSRVTNPAACKPGGLDQVSPLQVGFPFDDANLSEMGQKRLTEVAAWLACNPGVEVTVTPSADNHGDAAHMNDLANRRAQATVAALRAAGAANAIVHVTRRDAADPVTSPHLLIQANGRGW